MKRTDDPALAEELLDHCMFATLSLTLPDGSPYGIPISPVRQGNCLYFHCAVRGKKLDAMRAQPRICISCVGRAEVLPGKFDIGFQSAVAFGTAEEVTGETEKIAALRLICEKYCPDDLWDIQRVLDRYLPHTGIWKLTLDTITTKG